MQGADFAKLQAFAQVAQRRSFARAADELRIAPSTLSQMVRALEERLGVSLLVRTTRRVSLTSAGEQLLERFAPAMAEMEAALAETREGRERPAGAVRLHVPRPAFARHVEPCLGRIQASLPEVTVDVTVGDGPADVAVGSYDLVVRRAAFVDDGITALDLGGDLRHVVIAAPAYLAAQGEPAAPGDLAHHRCIRWRPDGGKTQLWWFEVDGEPLTLAADGPLVVSCCDAAVSAALQGVGIAYVLDTYCARLVEDGRLASLLGDYLPAFGGWKLCHDRKVKLTAATRAVAQVLIAPDLDRERCDGAAS